jgi:Ca-activated chloride channel family protein
VAVLFDLSGSIKDKAKKLRETVDALSQFAQQSHGSNEYSVVAFADKVLTVLDASRNPEAVAEAFRAISEAKFGRQSSFFDACWLTIPKLASGIHTKRVLILVTDGLDTYSRARESDITQQLKEHNVVVYSLNIGAASDGDVRDASSLDVSGAKVLEKLSKVSGGLALIPRNAKEVHAGVERIAAELRGQYVIGFRPTTPPAEGKCLKFKRCVTPPEAKELIARAREEFCAPRPDARKK